MKIIKNLCILLIITALLSAIILLLNSCSVLKLKKTIATDSTHVTRLDTGSIKTAKTSKSNDSSWHREIIYFGKDTVTNNYYTTPAVIYRESGKQSKQADAANLESYWKQVNDSTVVNTEVNTKNKKEEALGPWQIMAIALGTSIIVVLLSKIKISFT